MKASTSTIEQNTDRHFLTRMEEATTDERDAVFADLAVRALAGDELAARTIRVLVLPACRRIGHGKGEHMVAALVDAAYDEVLDWAVREGDAVR
jgi:GNAT superfamily N-acetyltransferase